MEAAANAVGAIIDSSNEGIEFLFGPVLPKEGLVFAFQVLPVIIFFAALTSVLYHWGVLQWVVKVLGGALQFALRTSKAESTFANFGSIAILIGTFGSISPGRRQEVAQFGIRAVLAGTLANLMNATIAGILIG